MTSSLLARKTKNLAGFNTTFVYRWRLGGNQPEVRHRVCNYHHACNLRKLRDTTSCHVLLFRRNAMIDDDEIMLYALDITKKSYYWQTKTNT
ncbi:hypothetical protein Cantr_09515 [Candida viswanathii]|uniref:Uncharacterized protein n=1 Tax=Candida viswanathii TaxID=5486 RepID=A0A367YAQ2_9ASCO|nr:hypothetical protein Cantr_09515 [Candida viswanathii]